MDQERPADCYAHDAKYEQLITDDHARQDHEGHTAEHEGGAGGDAADDDLERRINQRRQAKHEQANAYPDNAFEAGKLGPQLPRRVLLRRPEFRPGAGFLAVTADGATVDEADIAINDTYRLFGCESGAPDYEFGLERGIEEGFLAPYRKEEHITALTREAMEQGILYDHLLDPETRQRIDLPQAEQIELERLNKRILSEEQAKRWAETVRERTEYGEKVLFFAASQAHALMLVKALNDAFNDKGESPRYAEAIISENDEITTKR
jgi:hypothetical protein